MGVSGLMTYCNERRKDISQRVDLIQVARQQATRRTNPKPLNAIPSSPTPTVNILVDYYAFESYILPKFLNAEKEKSGGGGGNILRIYGGEYESYDAFVQRFLGALADVGVVFVFFIDSSRGSSADVSAHKLETWKDRFRETLAFYAEIRRVCYGKIDIAQLRDKVVRPCLLTVQTLISIREAGNFHFLIAI